MTELINLTPHTLTVCRDGEVVETIEPSGNVARVEQTKRVVGEVCGFELYAKSYGEIHELPAPREGVLYLVSGFVKAAVPAREDVLSPGDLIRNDHGRPVGCEGMTMIVE